MRSSAWPYGAYRQYSGDCAPRAPIETISGVLHVRDTIFGHKWIYKLNESKKGAGKKFINRVERKCFIWIIFLMLLVGLVVAAVVFTIIGPKYLDNLLSNNRTYNKWSYRLSSKIQHKIKRILNIQKSNYLQNIKLKLNETTFPRENYQILVPGCEKCLKTEICLQNSSEAYPECTPIKDNRDPTGCGGLCKLEVQFCKKLNATLNIFGCIDIESLSCSDNEWKCQKSLMCISKTQICDGVIHCYDRSDEYNCECDLKNNFRCSGDISCIPNSKRCDGSVDCWDASDELHCTKDCGPEDIPCFNGECILKTKWCNGNFDCIDKTDEPTGCKINSRLPLFE